jgi:NTE family protein
LQGGGSHAAFAAGVLLRLFTPELRDRFQLVALSGASGGAVCASLAWRGLVATGPEEACARLEGFWRDLEVHDLLGEISNFWAVTLARSPISVEVSPYEYPAPTEPALRKLLTRHLELEKLPPDPERRRRPRLLVSATDVLDGYTVVFQGESLLYRDVLASAAVPPLFRAIQGRYWDGLYSSNPPVYELTNLPEKPDEIWVVVLDPRRRPHEPRSIREITDRRIELTGSLSLHGELRIIEKINDLIQRHSSLRSEYKKIRIRIVQLDAEAFGYPSRLDRGRDLIEGLLRHGQERADWFFDHRSDFRRQETGLAGRASIQHEQPER